MESTQFDKYVALDILNRVHISIKHIEERSQPYHYFEVDADQIWWIIENELQPLKKAIQEMIESLKRILDE